MMTNQAVDPSIEQAVRGLYQQLLDSWNRRNATDMAACFAENGSTIGFDGSQINGRTEIEATIASIFANHSTAPYVSKVQEVRVIAPQVMLLRAIVGMVSPGKAEINPAVNAVQSLVAVKEGEAWRVALFQNTPAQFHGRPELVKQMTEELQALVG